MAKSSNSTSILIILLVVFTFPIWIGIAGGLFGVLAGLFGLIIGLFAGAIGLIVGIFGAIIGAIAKAFSWIFGNIFDWDFYPFDFVINPFTLFLIAIVIAITVRSRKQTAKK